MTQSQASTIGCAFLLLAIALSAPVGVSRQQPGAKRPTNDKLLESKVSEFQLHNETLLDGLWKLARGSAPFGFGFEKTLKSKLSEPDIPDPPLSLHLQGKSIREILNALCEADPRYTWSLDEGTVDVFPRAIVGDDSYLLNRRLPRFELKNATDVQNGLLAIARQLPPPVEQIAEAQLGGGDPYPPEPWSIALEDVTVREVVNRIASHGGPCGIWIFGGAKDFRAFGFFNIHPSPWLSKPHHSPFGKPDDPGRTGGNPGDMSNEVGRVGHPLLAEKIRLCLFPPGWPSIRAKALSRHKILVQCFSTACASEWWRAEALKLSR